MAEKNDLEELESRGSVSAKYGQMKEGKVNAMFGRIITRDGVNYKSQQRTDTDLTPEEKSGMLTELYEEKPTLFLARFGRWLSEEDLECFSGISGGYEIEYTMKKLKRYLADRESGTGVKNRRYEALVRLVKDTDYFSEHEMRLRCPTLYEEYIGRFMTAEEKLKRDEMGMTGEVTMSSFIFQQIDRDWLAERQELERETEEECMEEEEEEEEDDENDDDENEKIGGNTSSEITDISEEEKLRLRQEFLIIMKQQFLEGQDKDFDYTKVDTSEEFDNLEIFGQDEEDKYFDDEEPLDTCVKSKNNELSNDDDDYLSDKILQNCCATTR